MNYVVIDLEFNQYFDFNDGKGSDEPACPFEIIQLGAVKLDENLNIVDQKSYFVKPQIFTRMHPFVHKITGISLRDLKHERYFDEVYADFIKFAGAEKYVLCVWGSSDMSLLYRNVMYHKLNGKLLTKKYVNVQQMASEHFKQPSNTSIGLRTAVLKLELAAEIDFHNALNDAIYTAQVFKAVKKGVIPVLSFNVQKLKQATFAKTNAINAGLLFTFCERELSRKLTEKEKNLILQVYSCGHNKIFDLSKPDNNTGKK